MGWEAPAGAGSNGLPWSASTGITAFSATVAGTFVPIISVRPKAQFVGHSNRGKLELVQANTNNVQAVVLYTVFFNATLTGASFASVGAASIAEFDISATAVTGGQPMTSFYAGGNTGAAHAEAEALGKILAGVSSAGVQDTFTLTAAKVSQSDIGIYAALSWLESQQ